MEITSIVSYLVEPGKGVEDGEDVHGVKIPHTGQLYDLLGRVFVRSDAECTVPISFVSDNQKSEVRDLLLDYTDSPDLETGRKLGNRLRDCTTHVSGRGLLFLIVGQEENTKKIVISRFPADHGILANAKEGTLEVEFIERIFMKNSRLYKAALFAGTSRDEDFWDGHAVDRQIRAGDDQIASYWIRDFLASDFKTTSKAGTRRLAVALRDASQKSKDPDVQSQIVAAVVLAEQLDGQWTSVQDFVDQFHLSDHARDVVIAQLPNPDAIAEQFTLDFEEFNRHAAYKRVELDVGSICLAPASQFDECFNREEVPDREGFWRLSTVGRVIDERVKARKT